MQGFSLEYAPEDNKLLLIAEADLIGQIPHSDALRTLVKDSEYHDLMIYDGSLRDAIKSITEAKKAELTEQLTFTIGEAKPTQIDIQISSDQMHADIKLTGAYGGKQPRKEDFQQALALNGVVRGVSQKVLNRLMKEAPKLKPGEQVTELLAKGLPPRKGKNTRLIPLIDIPTDRVLKPKENADGSVDMRDLGEILSVKTGDVLAEVRSPGKGRQGYTVTHEKVPAIPGDFKEIKLGVNTEPDASNPKLIRATIEGQPKFNKDTLSVQSILELRGVNVATGNVKYKGSVLIKGDVAESMEVEATGDVVIEGFVESAVINSGGNIIVSQGCTGPADTKECKLTAQGKISIQHAQGVTLKAKEGISIGRQIAHSTIDSDGEIFIGRGDKPNGSIFACSVHTKNKLIAGNIGAVSGSKIDIDFTGGYEQYKSRQEKLQVLREQLASTNADHLVNHSKINTPSNRKKVTEQMVELEHALHAEQAFLQWLTKLDEELEENIRTYEANARVIATNTLYPNVTVTLGKHTFSSSNEDRKAEILLQSDGTGWLHTTYTG